MVVMMMVVVMKGRGQRGHKRERRDGGDGDARSQPGRSECRRSVPDVDRRLSAKVRRSCDHCLSPEAAVLPRACELPLPARLARADA